MSTDLRRAAEAQLGRARRRLVWDSPAAFARLYLGHHAVLPPCALHTDLYEMLGRSSAHRGSRIAVAAPRGYAKSTIVSMAHPLWGICTGRERFIVLISNTADQATGHLAEIKRELMENKLLARDFPEACEQFDRPPKPARWRKDDIITRNGVQVTALGAGQQLRGRKFRQYRPSLIVLDDVENDELVRSGDQRMYLKEWFTKAVLKAGDGTTNFHVVGTILHYDSLLAELTDPVRSPAWRSAIYKAVMEWSPRRDLWFEWEQIFVGKQAFEGESGPDAAKRFFKAKRSKMFEGTEVLWPQRESYFDLMTMRLSEGEAAFNCEKQNDPIDRKTALFIPDEFHYWTDEYETEGELLARHRKHSHVRIALDPSMGKHEGKGDYSAIVTLLVDDNTEVMYVLDAVIERMKPDRALDVLCSLAHKRNAQAIGIEANASQDLLVDQVRRRLGNFRVDGITNTTNKEARIKSLQPMVKLGRIRFNPEHELLIQQLLEFPRGAHDDGPDALQMAASMRTGRLPSVWVGPVDDDPDPWWPW